MLNIKIGKSIISQNILKKIHNGGGKSIITELVFWFSTKNNLKFHAFQIILKSSSNIHTTMADEKATEKIEPNCTSESVEKDILSADNDKEIDNGKYT